MYWTKEKCKIIEDRTVAIEYNYISCWLPLEFTVCLRKCGSQEHVVIVTVAERTRHGCDTQTDRLAAILHRAPVHAWRRAAKRSAAAYFGAVVFEADRGVAVVDGPVDEGRRETAAESPVAVDGGAAERHQRRRVLQHPGHPPATDRRQTVRLSGVVHGVLVGLGRPQRVVEVQTGRRPLRVRLTNQHTLW